MALWELPNNLVNSEWGGIAAAKGRKLCKIKLICYVLVLKIRGFVALGPSAKCAGGVAMYTDMEILTPFSVCRWET